MKWRTHGSGTQLLTEQGLANVSTLAHDPIIMSPDVGDLPINMWSHQITAGSCNSKHLEYLHQCEPRIYKPCLLEGGVPIFSVSYDYFFWDTRTPTVALKTMDNSPKRIEPMKSHEMMVKSLHPMKFHEIPWNPHEILTERVLVRDYGRGDLAQWGRPSWSQLW